jgi:1,4-dihydroxy-2-naphthoyl-CoA hydrolase
MADYTEKPKNWKDLPPEKLAEIMNHRSEGYLPALLGFTLVSLSKERVVARMAIEKHHLAPNDYLHAASVIALADTVCGTPAHIGRRTMVWDARVRDEKTGRDIALFRCTQMILPKPQ